MVSLLGEYYAKVIIVTDYRIVWKLENCGQEAKGVSPPG